MVEMMLDLAAARSFDQPERRSSAPGFEQARPQRSRPRALAGAVSALLASALGFVWVGLGRLTAARSRSEARGPRIVVVGASAAARAYADDLSRRNAGRIAAVFDDRRSRAPHEIAGAPVLGDVASLLSWRHLVDIDRIVLAVEPCASPRYEALLSTLRTLPQPVEALAKGPDGTWRAAPVWGAAPKPSTLAAKRAIDIVGSIALIVLFAPVMAALAAVVWAGRDGPVLFRQARHGLNGRVIHVLKFRTMRHETRQSPMRQVERDDPRVTKVGRLLRLTSLDELPQLINVLRGEMSLVGPRPHAVDMTVGGRPCAQISPLYVRRLRVRPGLTGWAQINGSRGPVQTVAELEERVRLDLEYIETLSIARDLHILFMTAPALLGDGLRPR